MTLVRSLCAAVEASVARKPVSLPLGAGILWSAFCELSLSRSMGPVGPNPITFAEIEA